MSHEPKPSEHAMRAAKVWADAAGGGIIPPPGWLAEAIDQHAIAPAVEEAIATANERIEARDKQWDDLWVSLNGLGIEAVTSGALIYEDGKDPVAERDQRIAELEEKLAAFIHPDGLSSLNLQRNLANARAVLAKSERSAP